MRVSRRLRAVACLLFLMADLHLLGSGCAGGGSHRLPPPDERPQARDLGEPLVRVDGEGTASLASYRGQVVLVHFFSTDCLPCLAEVPKLTRVYNELGERGFVVVGVSLDLQGAFPVQLLQERYHIRYPLLLASERMFRGETPFGPLPALPMSVLLDRRGMMTGAVLGVLDEERLRDAAIELLAEPRW